MKINRKSLTPSGYSSHVFDMDNFFMNQTNTRGERYAVTGSGLVAQKSKFPQALTTTTK